jgi:hypothetical protein
MSEFSEWVRERGAGGDIVGWVGDRDLREAWDECTHPSQLLWLLWKLGYHDDDTMREFAYWCMRQTANAQSDGRLAQRYPNGRVSDDELLSWAGTVAWSIKADMADDHNMLFAAIGVAGHTAAWMGHIVASIVARPPTHASATFHAVWADARRSRADRLREVVPFAVVERLWAARAGGAQ